MNDDASPEDPRPDDQPDGDQPDRDQQASLRGTVELPRVVLGDDDQALQTPSRRVLPGLVDVRWLLYPAYIACFAGGGLAVDFAIEGREWSAPPVALAWALLFFWQWLYGVAYRYRRPLLKYFSFLLVAGSSAGLAGLCWERADAQLIADASALVERGYVDNLHWAAICAVVSGALVAVHVVILGRGYRETQPRDTHQPKA